MHGKIGSELKTVDDGTNAGRNQDATPVGHLAYRRNRLADGPDVAVWIEKGDLAPAVGVILGRLEDGRPGKFRAAFHFIRVNTKKAKFRANTALACAIGKPTEAL